LAGPRRVSQPSGDLPNHPPARTGARGAAFGGRLFGVVWRPFYGDTTSLDCRNPQATADGIRFSSVSGVSRERIRSRPRSATGCQDDACGRAGAGRLVRHDDRPMTLAQTAACLQMSRAHRSNVINGKVAGVPPLRHVAIGRRILVKQRLRLGARRAPMSFRSCRTITASSHGGCQAGPWCLFGVGHKWKRMREMITRERIEPPGISLGMSALRDMPSCINTLRKLRDSNQLFTARPDAGARMGGCHCHKEQ